MAGSKLTLNRLLVLAALGFGLYVWFSEEAPPPVAPTAGVDPAATNAAPQPGYALNPRNSWPPEAGEAGAGLASDLFALNYFVVLDGSGSMSETECSEGMRKIEVARTALASFADSVPRQANLGLAVFDAKGLSERLPLGVANRDAFRQAVQAVSVNASTPLRSAMELAYDRLLEQGRRQLGYGEYHLVVVTDGHASKGEDPTPAVNRILGESPVVVHTIGFCIGERHPLNQPGRTYYRSANNPRALQQGLETVLAESPDFSVTQFAD